ncbi:type IV secretory system conjugative DNA transfer family protein [Jannaschia aquimarina]|uniref:TraG_2 protein n=1 Tax=Jannaschia aquimarina TaxID=935700 RepID=A0A0D1EFS0_9RHOB|nr:type IV secretory system conjugative DNA transfer family protein [Jannaschia aquimarina]KIT14715.1 Conjugal transfer protein TraG [Jannaschia aquimarina]SNT44131.1 type IV secretion system protein VirD4 [Jannaschia aquimarina]
MNPPDIEAAPQWQSGSSNIVVGRGSAGQLIGLRDDRHCVTVAGSRAGKGLSVILPNLATYAGSVCVLDPKGENAALTAERRGQGRGVPAGGMGQDVFVIDPFGWSNVADDYRSGFNPMAGLLPSDAMFVDECYAIADALVMADAKTANDHWNSNARLVLRGVIAWAATGPEPARNLVEVRRLLHLHPDDFGLLLDEMRAAPDRASGVPAEMAAALLGMGEDEQGSVLSTVRQNILFLSSPPMAACLSGTGRQPDLMAWKHGEQSVFLCLPAGLMGQHARFFRLFINRLMAAVEADADKPSIPALLLLDEMHVLGHMAQLETAAGLMAGYGLKIWSIWQDFTQAKAIYGDRWQTFLGNASLFQSFGLNDMMTLEYVSNRLGPTTVLTTSTNEISLGQAAQGFDGKGKAMTSAPLLTPDEVAIYFSRQSQAQCIIYPGLPPIWMHRALWLDDDFKPYRMTPENDR